VVFPRLLGASLALLLLLAGLATWLTRSDPGRAAGQDAETALSPAAAVADTETVGDARATGRPTPALEVEMTAYTSAIAQTDATPNVTASGAEAGPGTAAASHDLLERLPYGTQVVVVSVSGEGCGGRVPETPLTVADTMNPRIENHLDVWLETTEQALNWGRCQAEIKVLSSK